MVFFKRPLLPMLAVCKMSEFTATVTAMSEADMCMRPMGSINLLTS